MNGIMGGLLPPRRSSGGGVTDHGLLTGLADDDHAQYQLRTEKAQANGYAGLGAGGLVPVAQLGSGTPTAGKYLAGDGSWQTTPIVISAHSGLSGLSADDHTQYLLVDGTRAMSGNLRAPTISVGGAPLTGPLLSIPVAATASANYGEISIGSGPFDGSTSGFFVGNSNGTHIAINAGSGYLGRMIDAQIAGVRMFGVGRGNQASGASATLNAIDLPSFTVTITGNTPITTAAGFNYTRLGIPTYSAASALAITNAATLAIEGAPSGAGAGPATITNTYALWVQAGATRLDGRVINTANGAASTPGLLLSGAPFAGTGTTSFPLLYVSDSTATASTTLSTAGTYFGVNGHGTADLANYMLDGVSKFKLGTTAVTSTVPVVLPDGLVGTPSLRGSDTDSGIYFSGNNTRFAVDGTNAVMIGGGGIPLRIANTLGFGADSISTMDVILTRDAANTLAQRNGTTAQVFNIYNTYTDASNYERGIIQWSGNVLYFGMERAGTGVARDVALYAPAGAKTLLYSSNAIRWQVNTDGTLASVGNLNIWNGTSALATNATAGFLGHPSCAGTPTGVPASVPTGQIPMVYDSTNHKIYVYDGGSWRATAALT